MIDVPQLDNVTIMWHTQYWDAPLAGVLLYKNEPHYFSLKEEEKYADDDIDITRTWFRSFYVYELSLSNKIRLFAAHGLFQGTIGLHTDYFPINGRGIRFQKIKNRIEDTEVKILHMSHDYRIYEDLYNKLTNKIGKFNDMENKLIGWIYHKQLYENLPSSK